MASNWAPAPQVTPERDAVASHAAKRRRAISDQFKGERLVLPAGPLKVRSNDCDYRFRPHSGFAHLTGLGLDHEPDAVLIFEPVEEGKGDDGGSHRATLYFRPLAGRDTEQFYADARSGEFWIGARPTLAEFEARLGIPTAHIDELEVASPSAWCARWTKTSTRSWTPPATTPPRTRTTWTLACWTPSTRSSPKHSPSCA
jgi:Xaa-Pro aminopeptidase